MYIDSLVFSNKTSFRISRHVCFWVGWISYFTIEATMRRTSMYGLHTAFFSSATEVLCSTPIDMSFCYLIIYFLFPKFLFRGMYVRMVLLWLVFAILGFIVYHAYNMFVAPHIYSYYGLAPMGKSGHIISAFFFFFLTFNMEGCMAAAIKLGKMWYIKKQENDVLTYQKEKMEAFIHNGNTETAFLFHTFSRLQELSLVKAPQIAGMIARLQKITLFTLSQYQHTQVDLAKEVQILQELIDLQKEGFGENAHYNIECSGELGTKKIASFILLPLAENIFSQLSHTDGTSTEVLIKLNINKDQLKYEIVNTKPPQTSTLTNGKRDTIYQIKKRLNILYPGSHQLSVTIEPLLMKTCLRIDLSSIIIS
ncbi:MAG: histidine kinase [Bacteroidota bacterium]